MNNRRYSEPCTKEGLEALANESQFVVTFDVDHPTAGKFYGEKLGFATQELADLFMVSPKKNPMFKTSNYSCKENTK